MKNKPFYSIEKKQLIAMWVFGIIGAIYSIAAASEGGDPFFGLLAIGILFFLFYYTIGWRANNKITTP